MKEFENLGIAKGEALAPPPFASRRRACTIHLPWNGYYISQWLVFHEVKKLPLDGENVYILTNPPML